MMCLTGGKGQESRSQRPNIWAFSRLCSQVVMETQGWAPCGVIWVLLSTSWVEALPPLPTVCDLETLTSSLSRTPGIVKTPQGFGTVLKKQIDPTQVLCSGRHRK